MRNNLFGWTREKEQAEGEEEGGAEGRAEDVGRGELAGDSVTCWALERGLGNCWQLGVNAGLSRSFSR